jgi:hypothetical protein
MNQLETTLPSLANVNAFTCAEFADKLKVGLETQLARELPLVLNDDGGGIVKLRRRGWIKSAINVGLGLTLVAA